MTIPNLVISTANTHPRLHINNEFKYRYKNHGKRSTNLNWFVKLNRGFTYKRIRIKMIYIYIYIYYIILYLIFNMDLILVFLIGCLLYLIMDQYKENYTN